MILVPVADSGTAVEVAQNPGSFASLAAALPAAGEACLSFLYALAVGISPLVELFHHLMLRWAKKSTAPPMPRMPG